MLTKKREVQRRGGDRFSLPMAAATIIHGGALVVLDGGLAKPGYTATGLVAKGVSEGFFDNKGTDAALRADVRSEALFAFDNKADDPVVYADIGNDCYIHDDHTVAKTDGTGTRSIAGVVRDVDGGIIWISFK
ncbi:MAG: hypothetical protein JKY49_07515 [Cohaesibacteraceae bacterium]|nr:hypothetical protein [Cohaesibacteraceae bacterium]MBL4876694.1 hypothetical protein [Cohaesibacteraceae bacterium]